MVRILHCRHLVILFFYVNVGRASPAFSRFETTVTYCGALRRIQTVTPLCTPLITRMTLLITRMTPLITRMTLLITRMTLLITLMTLLITLMTLLIALVTAHP